MIKKIFLSSICANTLFAYTPFLTDQYIQPKINKINVVGNYSTNQELILNKLSFKKGDDFNYEKIIQSELNLEKTKLFEEVTIKKEYTEDNEVNINIEVNETITAKLKVTAGYSSYQGFLGALELNDTNFLGKGYKGSLFTTYSKIIQKAGGKLSIPHNKTLSSNIGIFASKELIEDVSNTFGDLETKKETFDYTLNKNLSKDLKIGLKYSLENNSIEYSDIDTHNQSYITSSLTPGISYNTVDNLFFPRNGYEVYLSSKFAGVGGDSQYIQQTLGFKYYKSLYDYTNLDWIFSIKGKQQSLFDTGYIPTSHSLYLGGDNSLRGLQNYSISSNNPNEPIKKSFNSSFELNTNIIPISNLRVGLFYDYLTYGIDSYNEIYKHSTGLSFKYYFKMIPLEVNFSKVLNEEDTDKLEEVSVRLGLDF